MICCGGRQSSASHVAREKEKDALNTTSRTADATSDTRERLLLATTNRHKLAEFRDLLASAPFALVDPSQVGLDLDVDETGTTFATNAAIKALAWAEAAGMLALADDSGLEIDALDGWPGVASARWIGPEVGYPERCRIILERMAAVPDARRTARYRCAIAVARPGQRLFAVEGAVEGHIAHASRGGGGFGYDPIFIAAATGETFGEMSAAAKHTISHRGRAAAAALPLLRQLAQGTQGDAAP